MNEMLLDLAGDALAPDGYEVLDSEVAFLKHATDARPFMVRGNSLCQWAVNFCIGRNIPYREHLSPSQSLRHLIPEMTEAQTKEICAALPVEVLPDLGLMSLTDLLQAVFPNALWRTSPGKAHAAAWLLWLYEQMNNHVFEPLLAEQSRIWQRAVDDASHRVYQATTVEGALQLLDMWLGATPDSLLDELGIFPLELPGKLQNRALNLWKGEIIRRRGDLLDDLARHPIPYSLKELVAQELVKYFEHHPGDLTGKLRAQLAPYLTSSYQERILKLMPPLPADKLPTEPAAVLAWFRGQYLPMRQWQTAYGAAEDEARVQAAVEQFMLWYLEEYPRALVGGALAPYLSFKRAASLQEGNNYVTLLIVPDGLHVLDARELLGKIQSQTNRLMIWEDDLAFVPLPTVTEVCKPALFAGVAPEVADRVPPLGIVLSENISPVGALSQALPGKLYLWRIMEPDSTYHRQNRSETLRHDIDGRLFSLASKIVELVESVPVELPLRLVLTSDHGRLLTQARRRLDVPVGMQSHGRATWGDSGRDFGERGFLIENGIVYLHAGRYGLPYDAGLAFGEDTFRTNDGRTGSEWYPHGGLYPEEVIVPWIELVRDVTLPKLTSKLSGRGQAGRQGAMTLQVRNPEAIAVTIAELTLTFGGRDIVLPVNATASPLQDNTYQLTLATWPTMAEVGQMVAQLSVKLPNNLSFVVAINETQLESIEMYRRDNILGDLDL